MMKAFLSRASQMKMKNAADVDRRVDVDVDGKAPLDQAPRKGVSECVEKCSNTGNLTLLLQSFVCNNFTSHSYTQIHPVLS